MAFIEYIAFMYKHVNDENKYRTYCIKLMFSGFNKIAQNTGFYTIEELKSDVIEFLQDGWSLEIFQVLNQCSKYKCIQKYTLVFCLLDFLLSPPGEPI